MQAFTIEFILGIEAMNEESAENKWDTFLSALDLKKNDKLDLIEVGELVAADGSKPKEKALKEENNPSEDDEDDEDWDDEDDMDDENMGDWSELASENTPLMDVRFFFFSV